MNELRRYAASSIHMEELSEFHDRVRGDKKKKKLDSIKEKLKPVKEKDFKRRPRQSKYATYTLLIETRARILEEAFNKKILALPLLANSHS